MCVISLVLVYMLNLIILTSVYCCNLGNSGVDVFGHCHDQRQSARYILLLGQTGTFHPPFLPRFDNVLTSVDPLPTYYFPTIFNDSLTLFEHDLRSRLTFDPDLTMFDQILTTMG